jgi:hypothetical protein
MSRLKPLAVGLGTRPHASSSYSPIDLAIVAYPAQNSSRARRHPVHLLEICPRDNHRDEHISLYP